MREIDEAIWALYEQHQRAQHHTAETIAGYWYAVSSLSLALPEDTDLYDATPDDITAWLAAGKAGKLTDAAGNPKPPWSDSTMATYARRVRTLYTWAAERELVERHPMRSIGHIREEEKTLPMPPAEDVVILLESIKADGKIRAVPARPRAGWERRFRSRRDLAMIGILCEPGTPRATALATVPLSGVDARMSRLAVTDKGRRERWIPYGQITATALTLYLRARKEHPKAALPDLFLSCSSTGQGRLTRHGVRQIIADRCDAAGIPRIHPHAFRHMTAHEWLAAGGSELDAMELFGWKSFAMVRRYTSSAAAERAAGHARQMSLGDKLMSGTAR